MPLEDLVDMEKEKERLLKEEERLKNELAALPRLCLNNEKFVSKAPAAKIRKRDKLAKY